MDPVAAILALAIFAGALWERKRTTDAIERERGQWAAERATLLHAARNPSAPVLAPSRAAPEPRPDTETPKDIQQYARVGTVQPIRDEVA